MRRNCSAGGRFKRGTSGSIAIVETTPHRACPGGSQVFALRDFMTRTTGPRDRISKLARREVNSRSTRSRAKTGFHRDQPDGGGDFLQPTAPSIVAIDPSRDFPLERPVGMISPRRNGPARQIFVGRSETFCRAKCSVTAAWQVARDETRSPCLPTPHLPRPLMNLATCGIQKSSSCCAPRRVMTRRSHSW